MRYRSVKVPFHEDAQWVIRIITEWAPSDISALPVESQGIRLVGPRFQHDDSATFEFRLLLEQREDSTCNASLSCNGTDVHAFQLAILRVQDHSATADSLPRRVPCDRKQNAPLHQGGKVERVSAPCRVERILVSIKLRDQGEDFWLIGGFKGNGHRVRSQRGT